MELSAKEKAALEVACPVCSQKAGEWCLYQDFNTDMAGVSPIPHADRISASRLPKSEAAPQPDPVQADEYRGHALKAVYRDGIPHLELRPPVAEGDVSPVTHKTFSKPRHLIGEEYFITERPKKMAHESSSAVSNRMIALENSEAAPYGILCDPTHCDDCADQFNKSQISLGVSMPTSEAPEKLEGHDPAKPWTWYPPCRWCGSVIHWHEGEWVHVGEYGSSVRRECAYSRHFAEPQAKPAELPEPILPPTPSPEGPKEDRGWLPQVLHRASLESLAIRWIQDKASDQDLRDLRDRISKPTAKEIKRGQELAKEQLDGITNQEIASKLEELNADDGDIRIMAMLYQLIQLRNVAGRAALSGAARDGDAYSLAQTLAFNEGVEAGAAAFEYTWQDWIGAAARIRREKLPIIAALSGEKEEK
jgi:hypothetical protein